MSALLSPHARRRIVLASLFLIAATSPVQAEENRDIVGSFALRDVTVTGEDVTGTLAVEVFNASDVNVTNATLIVEDPLLPDTSYATFSAVTVAAGDLVRLSANATVPKREYAYWRQGGTPSARLVFIDAAGDAIEQIVGLSPILLSEVE